MKEREFLKSFKYSEQKPVTTDQQPTGRGPRRRAMDIMAAKLTPINANLLAANAFFAAATSGLSSGQNVSCQNRTLHRRITMQELKSRDRKSSSDSRGRSALDDGMDRVCEKLDQDKAASVKVSIDRKLSKAIRRRLIPLKGERPGPKSPTGAPSSSHWPWIKKRARPMSKP